MAVGRLYGLVFAPGLCRAFCSKSCQCDSFSRTDDFSGSGTRPVPLKWTDLWDWVILLGFDGSPKWD
jgi:hypothetical protein